MRWFLNLRIRFKLILGFFTVAAIAAVVGVVGLLSIYKINNADTMLYEQNALGLQYSGEISTLFQQVRFNALEITVVDKSKLKEEIEDLNNNCDSVDAAIVEYETTISSEEGAAITETVKKTWGVYKGFVQESIELTEQGKIDEARDIIFHKAREIGDSLKEDLLKLVEADSKQAEDRAISNDQLSKMAALIVIAVVIVGVFISVFLGVWIASIISKPINRLVEVANLLAIGDVNANAEMNTRDEIGNLASSFNQMIENIRNQARIAEQIADGDLTVHVDIRSENDLMGKKLAQMVHNNNNVLSSIASAAEQVAVGAKQISNTSITLSQGATEQASSVEELTASLEEIASQTEINAKNANSANELAENAKNNALQGDSQMREMLKAMEEINESSANISKIIKVIDDIAFQTNILALNAAVEAARAGQHGKGFAVVAEEVRNLAARSANASKETTDMIESSIKKSEGGTRIAQDTAQALNQIVGAVERVANLVNDIAVASTEQSLGIAQINQGIMQVSQVVQTNSATSEESAAASQELSSQAELLKEEVGKFKISKDTGGYPSGELSPEIIRMLNKKAGTGGNYPEARREGSEKNRIYLNDNEFGKY